MTRFLHTVLLGRVNYQKALEIQLACSTALISGQFHKSPTHRTGVLLVLEHDPVYTTGLRTSAYPPSVEQALRQHGADFHRTNRGGLITFHGPGQLVAYPILDLKQCNLTIKTYVDKLEDAMIGTCSLFGVPAEKHSKYTGIWAGKNKLGAIGVHTSHSVTTHGLALNCSTDLRWFDYIVPCGIRGRGVSSLSKELKRTVTVQETIEPFLSSFAAAFNCKLAKISSIDEYLNAREQTVKA